MGLNYGDDVMRTHKVQLNERELEFIEGAYAALNYKSKSAYMRAAIQDKIRVDQTKLRELKRRQAMAGYGAHLDHAFEALEAEDFEDR